MASSGRVSLMLIIALLCMDCCFVASLPRNFDSRLSDDVAMPKKRPFCNAFTGCGRKRSLGSANAQELRQQAQAFDEDGLASLLDNENTIDELTRKILSEAKLWEAIQEASSEIARRKQKDFAYNQ